MDTQESGPTCCTFAVNIVCADPVKHRYCLTIGKHGGQEEKQGPKEEEKVPKEEKDIFIAGTRCGAQEDPKGRRQPLHVHRRLLEARRSRSQVSVRARARARARVRVRFRVRDQG